MYLYMYLLEYQLFFVYTPFSTTYDVWDAVWVFWVGSPGSHRPIFSLVDGFNPCEKYKSQLG